MVGRTNTAGTMMKTDLIDIVGLLIGVSLVTLAVNSGSTPPILSNESCSNPPPITRIAEKLETTEPMISERFCVSAAI